MRKAVYVIEILGFISAITCVMVLVCVANDATQPDEQQQAVITGSLG